MCFVESQINTFRNFIDCSNSDMDDCGIKKEFLLDILYFINLFKSYCCSFYGSMLWKYSLKV